MARHIYVFRGDREDPDFEEPEHPLPREQLKTLFEEKLDGMIQYRVLGKHYYTHNNVGLESNLKFEEMPCIRFDLRKTGVQTLKNYLNVLREEFGMITVFNPEEERLLLTEDSFCSGEKLENFLWPPNLQMSIEV